MQAQSNSNQENNLTIQQQNIVSISALTSIGDIDKLKTQFNSGLDAGLTINEIKEILSQLYAYCGFPRSLNGITTFMGVVADRKAKGQNDPPGKDFIPLDNNSTEKYERGRKVLETLTKTPQSKPAKGFGEFNPVIDRFLKEHLFADIFDSDILSYQQRELTTIASLAAMTGTEGQLQAHINMGLNTGLTEKQLSAAFDLIEKKVNKKQADIAIAVLNKVVHPEK